MDENFDSVAVETDIQNIVEYLGPSKNANDNQNIQTNTSKPDDTGTNRAETTGPLWLIFPGPAGPRYPRTLNPNPILLSQGQRPMVSTILMFVFYTQMGFITLG